MSSDITTLLRDYPQILIFVALALGYAIGKIKVRGFSLGPTTGCLLAALVIGQVGVQVPDLVKTIAFAFFIFGIGYKVGPAFFGGLKLEGIHYLWIALIVACVGLAATLSLGVLLGFNPGTTAGLLSGAMTQSAVIGTAEGALSQLSVTAAQKTTYTSDVAVAYAITYIFGTAGLIVALKLMPRVLGIDLKKEARTLEQQMSGGAEEPEPELFNWRKRLGLRVFKAENDRTIGKTVSQIEALFPHRVAIDKIRRHGKEIVVKPATVIKQGDIVDVVGYAPSLMKGEAILGPEHVIPASEDVIGETADIVVFNSQVVGKTLAELSKAYGHGLFLENATRQGHKLPLTSRTVIHRDDVLHVVGDRDDVERAAKSIGIIERPVIATDLITVGIGITIGTLIGLISLPLLGIPITLGVGGGVLISGLFFGWLRALHPTFGQVPEPSLWLFTDLGLNLFIVCVGLMAGPQAVAAIQSTGAALLLAGIVVTLLPMLAGLLFGYYVLKMNPVLLFGALTGAETCTAALNVIKEDIDSATPVIGYTVPYAIGNVLLTVWGAVIVNVMHRLG